MEKRITAIVKRERRMVLCPVARKAMACRAIDELTSEASALFATRSARPGQLKDVIMKPIRAQLVWVAWPGWTSSQFALSF